MTEEVFDEIPKQIDGKIPTQAAVLAEWGPTLSAQQVIYRKTKRVHAKATTEDGEVETIVDGECEERKPYSRGDYILIGNRGGRYAMSATKFGEHYHRHKPEPAASRELTDEGFCSYQSKGTIWAYELSEDEALHTFPSHAFVGSWGKPVSVHPHDFLAAPFPDCGEIYVIPGPLLRKAYERIRVTSEPTPADRRSSKGRPGSVNVPAAVELIQSPGGSSRSLQATGPRRANHRRSIVMTPEQLIQIKETGVAQPHLGADTEQNTATREWPTYIIHPHQPPRLAWDCISVLLIFYSIVAIPFVLAFDPPSARSGGRGAMNLINRGVDIIFMADVVLNFFTAIVENPDGSKMIIELSEIRRRYIKGWFIVDVLSAFPIDMIVNEKTGEKVKAVQMAKSFKIFRLLRVARIFRVMRLQRILNMTKYAFVMRHHARHLIIDLTVVLLLAHWCTCAFYGVGTIGCVAHGDEDEECTNSSWISVAGYEVRTAKCPSSYHHTVTVVQAMCCRHVCTGCSDRKEIRRLPLLDIYDTHNCRLRRHCSPERARAARRDHCHDHWCRYHSVWSFTRGTNDE